MRLAILRSLLLVGIFAVCAQTQAQTPVVMTMTGTGAYSILERSDWSRYDNGRYVGLTRNEVRATIIPQPLYSSAGTFLYEGNFFVLQSTLRDMRQNAQPVDAVIPVSFELSENGRLVIENDRGYPQMRGFPSFPAQSVRPGTKWQAPGIRAADPLNLGDPLFINFTAEYEYRGIETYRDMQVYRINAAYATRYPPLVVPPGFNSGGSYTRVQGSHRVEMLVRVEDGYPIFMRDELDETFTLADGSTVRFRGFTLIFSTVIIPMDRGEVIATLEGKLRVEESRTSSVRVEESRTGGSRTDGLIDQRGEGSSSSSVETLDNIVLTPVPEGIRLSIRDLNFIADSPELLPAERPRLDSIAEALKQVPNHYFLVEGHTASLGDPADEMRLSIERAKRIVDEMISRGIAADRFIYKGWGGTRPIGDNSNDVGRAANRRVEITILE